ncbi:rifin [Plasmodium reichenowi]|uniref:Rifin n=1 Tax=Plasmodium reichenowi TaxID=5854 RepID=A0A060RLZ6_PLARE|nr:rifin [Plasmodium reichenowi]
MKVHYINILLFDLPLNVIDHKKPSITPYGTQINRSLCECELYAPANYDNDPQMKKVMENFSKQTQQRFHEYDVRMKITRQECKEQCNKEIQKIILKDKLEKELMDKFAMLQTDIHSDAIPTCICEKSMADKVEKDCLRCGYGLGTVAPTVGLIGSVAVHAWKPLALKATIDKALELYAGKILAAAKAAGGIEGAAKVVAELRALGIDQLSSGTLESTICPQNYTNFSTISTIIRNHNSNCWVEASRGNVAMCEQFKMKLGTITKNGPGLTDNTAIPLKASEIVTQGTKAAGDKVAEVTAAKELVIETAQKEAIEIASYNWYTTIGYSVLAILIIVLIMVIIYKILRYRRKKKMKKKLQYIKLLEE